VLMDIRNPGVSDGWPLGETDMDYLKRAPFGGLFLVTFTVAATFQVLMALLGLLLAFLSPGLFFMNGAPATSPVQAVGVLLFLLVVGLVINAGISAIGALLWMGVRIALPKPASV
ncbi:MAG: hypothetical protein KKD26_08275, partial [Alphaproteobacteria bacterium]|nr:hypothetical protein [Alphaproteobacteria bacterium]